MSEIKRVNPGYRFLAIALLMASVAAVCAFVGYTYSGLIWDTVFSAYSLYAFNAIAFGFVFKCQIGAAQQIFCTFKAESPSDIENICKGAEDFISSLIIGTAIFALASLFTLWALPSGEAYFVYFNYFVIFVTFFLIAYFVLRKAYAKTSDAPFVRVFFTPPGIILFIVAVILASGVYGWSSSLLKYIAETDKDILKGQWVTSDTRPEDIIADMSKQCSESGLLIKYPSISFEGKKAYVNIRYPDKYSKVHRQKSYMWVSLDVACSDGSRHPYSLLIPYKEGDRLFTW